MSTEIRWRRGTAAQHATFTGAVGEITVVTDDYSLRIHDGITAGGHPIAGGSGGGGVAGLFTTDLTGDYDDAERAQARENLALEGVGNSQMAVYTTSVNLNAAIPYDDTIPQSTEGVEILTVSLAASSPTARVRIRFDGGVVNNTNDNVITAALFMDSESGARRAVPVGVPAAGITAPAALIYEFSPGDTASHTYKIRMGTPNTTPTFRLNGSGGTRIYGGVAAATLTAEEV
ncbi:MAG: hypothetical protein ACOH2M_27060 [Cypionkella sp.]